MASATSPAVVAALADLSSALGEAFTIVRGPICGWHNHVYEIASSNNDRFVLRIHKVAGFAKYAAKGVEQLKRVQELGPSTKLPTVIRQTDEYNVLSYIPGEVVPVWDTRKISDEHRRAILDDLAKILYANWTVSLRAPAGTYEPMDYEKWLQDEVDRALIRALDEGQSGWGDPIYFLYRRNLKNDILPEVELGYASVNYGFMESSDLVVKDNELSGVVDWDDARLVPGPAAIHAPLFIAGIPGWNTDAPEGMDFSDDKEYFFEAITHMDVFGGMITDMLTTSFDRQFLEMSLRNPVINAEYVRLKLQNPPQARTMEALMQLEDFVATHEDMRFARSVVELRGRLKQLLA